ncbi:MAG: hypothetical protein KAH22_08965 [Thiotrichaceae bacterium]|nr:hypothetical protein [Thiotrichaceae bacterium]
MSTFISLLQILFFTALIASWAGIILYFRNPATLKSKTKESKALWLFISLATSFSIIAFIMFHLMEQKTELHKPTKLKQVGVIMQEEIKKPNNENQKDINLFLEKIHPALAKEKKRLQNQQTPISKTITNTINQQKLHPNHQEYLGSLIVLQQEEKALITQFINKILLYSSNAYKQINATQTSDVVKSKFKNECDILLKEAGDLHQQRLKQRLKMIQLINNQLKFSREQLAKQQRKEINSPPPPKEAKFSNKNIQNIQILQRYAMTLDPKLEKKIKTISAEILSIQKNKQTLKNLIVTEETDELKQSFRRALKAWKLTEIKAYRRWTQLLYALESAYLVPIPKVRKSVNHVHLIQQIKEASKQFLNETQIAHEEVKQQYYSIKEPKELKSKQIPKPILVK